MFRRLTYSEQDILADIRSGGQQEDAAISFLLRKHGKKIVRFVQSRNGSKEEAEDVLQEGIVELIMSVRKDKFKGGSSVATFLFAICKNIWFKKFKKITRGFEPWGPSEMSTDPNPEVTVILDEQKRAILALFDHLKDKCRDVLYLWGLNYSMKEIASKLAYSSDQVAMNKKNLCLKEIRNRIQKDAEFRQMVSEII